MGKASEHMIETQAHAAVAKALRIEPDDLDGFGYQVHEDTDRSGNVTRTYVKWDDEIPDGVGEDADGSGETTIVLPDEPEPDEA